MGKQRSDQEVIECSDKDRFKITAGDMSHGREIFFFSLDARGPDSSPRSQPEDVRGSCLSERLVEEVAFLGEPASDKEEVERLGILAIK